MLFTGSKSVLPIRLTKLSHFEILNRDSSKMIVFGLLNYLLHFFYNNSELVAVVLGVN